MNIFALTDTMAQVDRPRGNNRTTDMVVVVVAVVAAPKGRHSPVATVTRTTTRATEGSSSEAVNRAGSGRREVAVVIIGRRQRPTALNIGRAPQPGGEVGPAQPHNNRSAVVVAPPTTGRRPRLPVVGTAGIVPPIGRTRRRLGGRVRSEAGACASMAADIAAVRGAVRMDCQKAAGRLGDIIWPLPPRHEGEGERRAAAAGGTARRTATALAGIPTVVVVLPTPPPPPPPRNMTRISIWYVPAAYVGGCFVCQVHNVQSSVVDPKTLNLDPDPRLYYQFRNMF